MSNKWGALHYGYPFYFFSMLTLLPLRLMKDADFFGNVVLNILVLRQMISVLPMILTAGVLTFTFTHFRKLWASLFSFLFMLTIPAVVRSNLHWWHPDALMMLSIALTFFFLDRDEFGLGWNFIAAAAACGIAVAIKLMGLFFFLVIPVYLVVSRQKNKFSLKKTAGAGILFLLMMVLVVVFSNPFLFYKIPREEMAAIQTEKFKEISEGYANEESLYYSRGPQYWEWTLSVSYGDPNFPVLLLLLLTLLCLFSRNREKYWIMLGWIVPLSIYLMWFVAPKPDHYLLPLLIPLYATILVGFDMLSVGWKSENHIVRYIGYAGSGLFLLVVLMQWDFQISRDITLYTAYFSIK